MSYCLDLCDPLQGVAPVIWDWFLSVESLKHATIRSIDDVNRLWLSITPSMINEVYNRTRRLYSFLTVGLLHRTIDTKLIGFASHRAVPKMISACWHTEFQNNSSALTGLAFVVWHHGCGSISKRRTFMIPICFLFFFSSVTNRLKFKPCSHIQHLRRFGCRFGYSVSERHCHYNTCNIMKLYRCMSFAFPHTPVPYLNWVIVGIKSHT